MAEGVLVLVATPIGNLGDLSPRATAALAEADAIACEDTRRTRRLLSVSGISGNKLFAVHEHNEASMVPAVLERLGRGEKIAVVSDAGMPGISDPGERLVAAACGAGFRVEVIPGPSAAIAALVVSGLPTARWCFEGFLPRKHGERQARLVQLAGEPRTLVLYEAPTRVAAVLAELAAAWGIERRVAVVRELTKVYEETWRGTLGEAAQRAADPATPEPRGEYVIVIDGAPPPAAPTDEEITERLIAALEGSPQRKRAVEETAAALSVSKRRVYELAVRLPRVRR